ncbi:MAG: group 1 truncated hemoglobin [Rhodanobacteraceae bacterium]|nr:group 1 truncated hemoglobin [Rhodanobacteraceae bacterium]
MTIYQKLGGAAAIDAAVDIFYRRVLSDERVSNFFDDVDMERQHAKQRAFLTMVLGGPHEYSGRDLRSAHQRMALNDGHFDAVAEHLEATLQELQVGSDDISAVLAVVEGARPDVLDR